MDGSDGDVDTMVAMLVRIASTTLPAAVVLPEVFPARTLHGTGRHDHAARLHGAEATQIVRSEQRDLSLLQAP